MSKHFEMNTAPPEEPEEEGRLVENPDITALTQLNAAEINQQIMTARAYPRSVTGFRRSMREMVTYDEPTALSCLYALKRSGKVIEGPSIRFAEAAIQSWGNARAGARIVEIGDEFITAQGFFYDLEKNMALAFEVMRRITDKEGNRYGDDMIGVTGNAACSIALRNAILRGVPKTAWNEPYQAARHVSVGKGESISVKREEMIKAFAPLGVTKEQIFGLLGVKGVDDVSIDQLIFMGGVLNSIKEGEQKTEDVFALENMITPGQVKPPQPKRSEFRREDKPAATVQGGGGGTAGEGPKSASGSNGGGPIGEVVVTNAGGSGAPAAEDEAAAVREQERLDWVKDAFAELEKQTKLIDRKTDTGVTLLRDRILDAGVMTVEEEDAWKAACDQRAHAIMQATRGNKK